jgi:hypothetical protein
LIIGDTDANKRVDTLRQSQICFAISKLGSEGADDSSLDTLFWLTPYKSENALQQSMGRIQRVKAGKKSPVMTIFEDWMCSPLKVRCLKLKSTLRKWKIHYDTLRPEHVPTQLPADVKEAYDRAYSELPSNVDGQAEVLED